MMERPNKEGFAQMKIRGDFHTHTTYSDAAKIQLIRKYGELETEEYREDGIFVRAYVPAQVYAKVSEPM